VSNIQKIQETFYTKMQNKIYKIQNSAVAISKTKIRKEQKKHSLMASNLVNYAMS
jgi:nicotinic acid mononucleotide adenylyltransferase